MDMCYVSSLPGGFVLSMKIVIKTHTSHLISNNLCIQYMSALILNMCHTNSQMTPRHENIQKTLDEGHPTTFFFQKVVEST